MFFPKLAPQVRNFNMNVCKLIDVTLSVFELPLAWSVVGAVFIGPMPEDDSGRANVGGN